MLLSKEIIVSTTIPQTPTQGTPPKPKSPAGAESPGADNDISDAAASAEALWARFFARQQITDAKTDGAGGCALQLGELRCVVRCLGDDGLLQVQLHVLTLPKAPAARGSLCEALMVQATDLCEGDVLGIDTVEDAVGYQRMLSLDDLDTGELTESLWDMADAVADLQTTLPKPV